MNDLFGAIRARYLATDLAAALNGVFVGDAWPGTNRPYLSVAPLLETGDFDTNKAHYVDDTLEVHVLADDVTVCTSLAYLLQKRFTEPPMEFTAGGRLLNLKRGDIAWRQEDQFWRAVVTFIAKVTR